MFAARFRECASRALLLPRRHGRRMPLWQQRHRAAQLLQVARQHPDFPITVEAARECLNDCWDLSGLLDLLGRIRSGRVRLVEVVTPSPSPFAATMLYRYTGTFMYEGDLPMAERRAQSLALDPALLSSVLGRWTCESCWIPASWPRSRRSCSTPPTGTGHETSRNWLHCPAVWDRYPVPTWRSAVTSPCLIHCPML